MTPAMDRVRVEGTGRLGTDAGTAGRAEHRLAHARMACNVAVAPPTDTAGATEPVWMRIIAYGTAGEVLAGARKGDEVTFAGVLTWNVFQPRRGEVRRSLQCIATEVSVAPWARPAEQPEGPKVGIFGRPEWDRERETFEEWTVRLDRYLDERRLRGAERATEVRDERARLPYDETDPVSILSWLEAQRTGGG